MAGIDIPSREDLAQDYLEEYRAELPDQNSARGSDPYRKSRVVSAVAWSILAKFVFVLKNLLPDTADEDFLQRWGSPKVLNVPRKGPTPSQGIEALLVTGLAPDGTVVAPFLELAHADGTLYQITPKAAGDWTLVGGAVNVSVAAVTKGAATNKVAGDLLTFTSPPGGINAGATLILDLVGGAENEPVEDYRGRVIDDLADPPTPDGGAIHDFASWPRRVPGVQKVCVYEHRGGLGTIDVAALQAGRGAARILADVSPVQAVLDLLRVGGAKDVRALAVVAQSLDVTAEIEIDETSFQWDWDDEGVTTHTITAFDSAAKTITVPTAPAVVTAGVRLTVGGEEARVTLRTGNVLTLAFSPAVDGGIAPAWFSFNVTTFAIRASGDLVVPVREALLEQFDQLGPARGSHAATSWDDSIRVSKLLGAAVDGVVGVIDASLDTPTVNIAPDDPFDTDPTLRNQINLLVPGRVVVVRMPG